MTPTDDTGQYQHRRPSGKTSGGLSYVTDLAGPGGVHLHLWIGDHGPQSDFVTAAVEEMRHARDVLGWSFSRCQSRERTP